METMNFKKKRKKDYFFQEYFLEIFDYAYILFKFIINIRNHLFE